MAFSLQMSRKFSTASCLMIRRLTKRSNPGLGHQIIEIEDAAKVIQSDPEGFEGLESDLINAHKSYNQHKLSLQYHNEKIRQYIIKKKYFRKEPLPNLLTYAEKEQIKYLNSNDGEEWTLEKLAESFPANVETISKILKSHWTPMSSKRILAHDTSVLENWERFKRGEFSEKISTELHEHLKKFVDREVKDLKILPDRTKIFQKKQWQRPKSNEFSSIISSLHPKSKNVPARGDMVTLSDGNPIEKVKRKTADNADSETYLLGKIQNKKPITINELKNKQRMLENEKNLNDHLAVQNLKNISGTGIIHSTDNSATSNGVTLEFTEKFISNEVVIGEDDRKRYGMSTTKERIYIPRKLWKKGATYRTNDCYYDDDGEFLYRVPGMTSQ